MVYFVKCFTQVYCTQIDCVPSFSETLNITDRQCIRNDYNLSIFETKLVVISLEKFGEFLH